MLRRIALSALVAGGSIALFIGLSLLGAGSRGPLSALLASVGSTVRSLENKMVSELRGGGRSQELAWFAGYRTDPARLRAPERMLLGAYDDRLPHSFAGLRRLEQALGSTMPLIHVYVAWGDRPEQAFPRTLMEEIWELGSLPVLTWEPWLGDFDGELRPELAARDERDRGGLASVARGDYDFHIDRSARAVAEFGRPLFIRFAHEMNDPYRYPWGPHNNDPEAFIAAWRRVVERFRNAGAHNAMWVWSPHLAYAGFTRYYPGDDVTDWVATGVLNFGDVARWSQWWSFAQIFSSRYEQLGTFGKPIMLAELGSLAVGGDRAEWFARGLGALPQRHPQVRAVLFFQSTHDATVTYQPLDWSFVADEDVVKAVSTAIADWGA